jgi:YVTN family beta-propeller protein
VKPTNRAFLLLLLGLAPAGASPEAEGDRSPADVALSPDGRWAVTANRTSDSASLVDLEGGKVVAEVAVGRRPFAVAVSPDGRRAAVTNWLSDDVAILKLEPPALVVEGTVPVGDEPRGVAWTPDGSRVVVVISGEDALASVDGSLVG